MKPPQCPLTPPTSLLVLLTHSPYPQYMHLVVRSGTFTGQHDMSSAYGSGWWFVRCIPPHHPYAPSMPPGIGVWWPRVVLTWVPLTWAHFLLSAIDCLQFSRILCNTPSSFFTCNPQCPLTPLPSVSPIDTPTPSPVQTFSGQESYTVGQHNFWLSCGSGWCLVRYTTTTHPCMPPMPQPQYSNLVAKNSTTSGQLDIWSAFGPGWPVYARVNLVPWYFQLHEWILKLLQLKTHLLLSSVFNSPSLVFMSMSTLQYTVFSFQEYDFSCLKLSLCLQYPQNIYS